MTTVERFVRVIVTWYYGIIVQWYYLSMASIIVQWYHRPVLYYKASSDASKLPRMPFVVTTTSTGEAFETCLYSHIPESILFILVVVALHVAPHQRRSQRKLGSRVKGQRQAKTLLMLAIHSLSLVLPPFLLPCKSSQSGSACLLLFWR